jgi:DNA-damage-inducible protein J
MDTVPKKKMQFNIDEKTYNETARILDNLGISPTNAFTAYWRKIAATGSIPFDLSLTSEQMDEQRLLRATANIPVGAQITSMEEFEAWFNEDQ